jgi:Flp pilus assembly protein protease CpaA
MNVLASPLLPLSIGFLFLALSGYWEYRTYRVPNTLVLISFALAVGLSFVRSAMVPEATGGLGSQLWCTILAGLALLQPYLKSALGAGCVKAHAAFGAWVGCGFDYVDGTVMILCASVVAGIFTVAVWRITCGLASEDIDKGKVRLLHGQFPLSIGTLLGVVVWSTLW